MKAKPQPRSPFAAKAREFPQERARRTYEALIAAGAEAFAERGFDATGTPEIAARAGVAVGTFYRYFEDKLELYLEIMRRELHRASEQAMARLTPAHFVGVERRHTIDLTLAVLVDNFTHSPAMERLFVEMALRDDKVAALKRAFDDAARSRLAELIARICPRDEVTDPEATAFIIHAAVVECALAISGARGTLPISRPRGLAALSELVYRSLFGFA